VDGLLGNQSIVEYYKLAQQLAPSVLLFLNDFSILASYDTIHCNYTMTYIQWLLNQGAPVHGLGLRLHFSQGPVDMEEMWNCIQLFALLPIQVCHVTYDTHDTQHTTHTTHTHNTRPTQHVLRFSWCGVGLSEIGSGRVQSGSA
jgi:GH35 family endo-1,4-beta-xylanase